MTSAPRERFEALDTISRQRALSEAESLELEALRRAISRDEETRRARPWTTKDDRAFAFVDRSRRGWAKAVAPLFGRTEGALYQRAWVLDRDAAEAKRA